MKLSKATLLSAMFLTGFTPALADENASLVVNGEVEMTTKTDAPEHISHVGEVISGWVFRTDETQALQMDDFDNPALLFVDQAQTAYSTVEGSAGKSCASCHENVEDFAGLRASLPRVNNGKIEVMEELINTCRTERMGAEAWKWSGTDMTAMNTLISLQSRGMPVNVSVPDDGRALWEAGQEMYYTRYGQLKVACANCHEDNYGNNIRADHLSQGQINGFPTYRLKNTKMNSTHARFRGCMNNIRAEPFKEGSDEFKALEYYLATRGNGLSIESPSVRN